MLSIDRLDWEKMNNLIPVVVQNAFDGHVLMQAYMSQAALDKTLESGFVTFWSRSREALWTKGETSGHRLELVSIHPDCDGDCLLVLANPQGPTCHLGTESCFDGATRPSPSLAFLARLESVIANRQETPSRDSYTSRLLDSGPKRIAQKVGEEGVETALAGAAGDQAELLDEAADLVYHLMVMLRARDLKLSQLVSKLSERHQK